MQRLKTDWILFGTTVGLAAFGVVILYSASSVIAAAEVRLILAFRSAAGYCGWRPLLLVMMALKRTHYRKLQNPAVAFAAIGLVLMLLGLVFFVDSAHHRWLRMGPLGLQPSELAKPALVIFLAYFVTWRARAINNCAYTLMPAALAVGLRFWRWWWRTWERPWCWAWRPWWSSLWRACDGAFAASRRRWRCWGWWFHLR